MIDILESILRVLSNPKWLLENLALPIKQMASDVRVFLGVVTVISLVLLIRYYWKHSDKISSPPQGYKSPEEVEKEVEHRIEVYKTRWAEDTGFRRQAKKMMIAEKLDVLSEMSELNEYWASAYTSAVTITESEGELADEQERWMDTILEYVSDYQGLDLEQFRKFHPTMKR